MTDETPLMTLADNLYQSDEEMGTARSDHANHPQRSRRYTRWARKLCSTIVLLLPSFLHTTINPKDQSPQPVPIENHWQHTLFLDGMRGLAAFCVFLEHFIIPFRSTILYAYGGHEDTSPIQLPILRLAYGGSPMVCIFFVISGIALSLKPARLIENRQWDLFYRVIESMIFRRGIRLFVPALIASLFLMISAHLHLCDIQSDIKYEGPHELLEGFWMKQPHFTSDLWAQIQQWLDFILIKVLMPNTWRGTNTGRDFGDLKYMDYGSQLWTLGVEYWSSLILFGTILGIARFPTVLKIAFLAIATCFSFWVSRWDVALFYWGSVLANTSPLQGDYTPRTHSRLHQFVYGFLLGVGLHIASFPELGSNHTPGFVWLSSLATNPRVWQSVGAAIIVTAICNIQTMRDVFSCRFLVYLGRISFSLYILHIPLLVTVGWRLVHVARRLMGRETNLADLAGLGISFAAVLILLIWAADIFHRCIDEPCISLARRLEKRVKMPDT